MLETRNNTNTNPNLALFAFKPRQVLLAEHNMKTTTEKEQGKILTLNPEKKALLHHSILRYLQRNGFTKTLKRFLSEAHIESDNWEASSLDLEDMYCKSMDACAHSDTNLNTYKEQELVADGTTKKVGNSNCATYEEIKKEKKKKGSDDSDSITMADQSKVNSKKLLESGKNCGEKSADILVTESEAKPKEKKKSKRSLDSPGQTEQVKPDVLKNPVDDAVHEFKIDDSTKRSKDKKRKGRTEQEKLESLPGETEDKSKHIASSICNTKNDSGPEVKHKGKKKKSKSSTESPIEDVEDCGLSNKQEMITDNLVPDPIPLEEKKLDSKDKKGKKECSVSQRLSGGVGQVNPVRADTENEGLQPSADATKKEKKSSKKRKRLAYDENEYQGAEMEAIEESKHRKPEDIKESKNEDLLVKGDAVKSCKGENVQVDHNEPHKISMKQLDGHPNGKFEMNGGDKSGSQKTIKKHCNGSAEPKTVNAFQRVKVDDVVFADEKLQDNSYWAKDGAEVGYGAKAQEVLGQVKGRDFRHEKTKKKRGSYRGGQIDLQSHSIKFNYSDED